MLRQRKNEVVKKIEGWLSDCKVAIVTDYRGMTVSQISELRRQMTESGLEYHVVKNNLASIAADSTGKEELKGMLTGPTAIAFGYSDVTEPAKILAEYIRTAKVPLSIRGGLLGARVLSTAEVTAIATLPPREVLLARLVGQVQAPISSLLAVLNANLTGIVQVLQARIRQVEGG